MKLNNSSIHKTLENSFYDSFTFSHENSSVVVDGSNQVEFIKRHYLKAFLEQNNLDEKDIKLSYHAFVDEICIYYKGKWDGYFDNYLIKNLGLA